MHRLRRIPGPDLSIEPSINLPGLQLGGLTIGDCWHRPELKDDLGWQKSGREYAADCASYELIEGFARFSDGWQELRYVSPTTGMLDFASGKSEQPRMSCSVTWFETDMCQSHMDDVGVKDHLSLGVRPW